MKVRMLKTVTISAPPVAYKAGQTYEVPTAVAQGWSAAGLCEMDKMEAPALETKTEPEAGEVRPKTTKPKTTKAANRPTGD